MKCKRLCAWLLSLVMMFSLLPVSAAAADHEPTIKWGGLTPLDYTLSVQVFHENEGLQWEKTETEKHLWVDVHPASGTEVYKADSDGGSYLKETGHFTFGFTTKASLKLYTRSTAGHKVTVEYVYTDDESKNDSKFENVKYAEEKSFGSLDKKDYGYEITVSSGDAKYEVNSLNVLRVTGGAEASVITVTYTPKDVIYIDQYYDNGKLWVKWTENNIKVNGPELLNGAAEAAVIEGENLTDAVENYRFLTVDGVTYDFSFASLVPVKGNIPKPITDVWYDRDEGTWYYSHTDRKGVLFGLGDKVPVVNRGCVNFCYNTPHTENSEHHDWKWVHVAGTEKENSQHQQVCKHCNKEGTIECCKFDLPTTETGAHTCKDCGYSYTDEITPTGTPVYVYFKTVNTKNELVKVESGVTYNANGSSWATLGKLVTATTVTPEKKNILGAEVKTSSNFVKHDSNKDFDLDWISEWVALKRDNGAAGYESEAPFGTHVWHLDGQVNVCKLSYDANRPAGVTADVTVPDSAYYLPGWNAPVSTDDPTLQGYVFGGWYREPKCVNEAKEKVAVAKDTVLYAKWTRNSSHGGDDGDDDDYFAIQKVDAQDGHALNGAKFELYQLDKNDRIVNRRVVKTTQQGNKSGIALFSVDNKKSYDGIWYYAEVSAPEGYVLDRTEYEINHKDFSDSLSAAVENVDTVRNYRGTTPDLLNDSDHFAYVIGYMDGNVRPYGLISRAETTTIFFRLLKDSVRDGNLLTSNTYTDVPDDYWANTAISTMTGLGIVQGRSTTTFDPKAPITRAQFAAICARFDTGKSNGEQTFSDIQGHWAEKYIQRAAELGWIKGFEDGTFRPDTYITRAQAMTMINRVLNRIPEDESDLLPGMNVWPDCNPGDWFYLAIQEATNSHDYRHKAGCYETWTRLTKDPDWTRYEN